MIEINRRRSSVVRLNERRTDFVSVLGRLISESKELGSRKSINPLQSDPKIFRCLSDDTLTLECLTALIGSINK
jgi:hypothetical protein